jgi:hypothetical protein
MMPKSVSYLFVHDGGGLLLFVDDFTDTLESYVYDLYSEYEHGPVMLNFSHLLASQNNPKVKALYVWDNWE